MLDTTSFLPKLGNYILVVPREAGYNPAMPEKKSDHHPTAPENQEKSQPQNESAEQSRTAPARKRLPARNPHKTFDRVRPKSNFDEGEVKE